MKRVKINNETGCHEWTGGLTKKGYAIVRIDNRQYYVHRLIYSLTFGAIQKNMMVCHKCDNRKCINPDHLFLGTAKDNTLDMVSKGRSRARKILLSDGNGDLFEYRDQRALAKAIGVTQSAVSYALKNGNQLLRRYSISLFDSQDTSNQPKNG